MPEDKLQNKANRYYFKDSVNLDKGEVYISPFDLNIEGGVIEKPLKPMIRFITPVFDSKGQRTGFLVFNYLGKEIIDRIKMASAGAMDQPMLLNSEGYWLKGPNPEDEWGFMYEEGQDRKFSKLFPNGWKRISNADSGQFQNEDGLFTFTTINLIAGALTTSTGVEGYKWIFVSHIPPKLFNAIRHRLLRGLLSLYASLVFLVGGGSWYIASASMRRKLAEEKLRKYRAIGQLSSSVGHELRNPLGVISNSVHYLGMKIKDGDEKVNKHLAILKREVIRSNKIISDLLDFSRAKEPEIERGNLNRIINESLAYIKKDERISVETRLDTSLPEILIDPDQIHQVILNLLTNAVHAMPDGGRIDIMTRAKDNCVEMVFKDTGVGIPKEDLRKIFAPLYTTKTIGTGLGLSIVRGIVDRHKGKIGVESKVGEGSTFTVSLPLQRKET